MSAVPNAGQPPALPRARRMSAAAGSSTIHDPMPTMSCTVRQSCRVISQAARGDMVVPLAGSYPLDGIADALSALRSRSVLGRQVLIPN